MLYSKVFVVAMKDAFFCFGGIDLARYKLG
jgi:hypothetical protein